MTDHKRVLILTSNAGFGHISAARAIGSALNRRYGDDVSVLVFNPMEDERVPGILRGTTFDYDQIVQQNEWLHAINYWVTNQALPSSIYNLLMAVSFSPVIRNMIQDFQPDVIVTAYLGYHSTLNALKSRRGKKIPVFTVVTDLADVHRLWFNSISDYCLVPTPQVRAQALKHRVAEGKIRITGIPVNPRLEPQEETPQVVRKRLGWDPDTATALVVGSKRVRNLESYLAAINDADLSMQLAVITGGDNELFSRLQQMSWKIQPHLYPFVDDISSYMHAADLVITKAGGLIISETLACGKPLLLMDALPGQEIGNVQYVVQEGVGLYADTPLQAISILKNWLDSGKPQPELINRTQKARQVGRPFAADEIARLIWASLER